MQSFRPQVICRKLITLRRTLALALALGLVGLGASPALAVPAFAVQTGQACQACHVGGFGPQLTRFGREFKLRGYTMRAVSFNTPLSIAAIASYAQTQKSPAAPPAADFGANNNFALDQINLFVAGGLGSHLGGFIQATYDGIAKAFTWDNLDIRATTTTQIKGADVVLGASLNNAPTVDDVWNTLPAWGYPYTSSGLTPSPAATPLLSGPLFQNTLGLTGYAWINSEIYLEGGAYGSPGAQTLTRLGADPFSPGNIRNLAPYGRIAYQKTFGAQNVQVGAFGMKADIYPGRDESAGTTDRYTDLGLDASYQLTRANSDIVTVNARYLNERQALNASYALGLAANPRDTLVDLRANAAYYWRNRIGGTIQAFQTTGSADPVLYAANRALKPDSSGLMFQIDATPWGAGASPLGPRFNMRVGVQYTLYAKFDGAGSNYDGAGSNAADNNTLRVFTWFAY